MPIHCTEPLTMRPALSSGIRWTSLFSSWICLSPKSVRATLLCVPNVLCATNKSALPYIFYLLTANKGFHYSEFWTNWTRVSNSTTCHTIFSCKSQLRLLFNLISSPHDDSWTSAAAANSSCECRPGFCVNRRSAAAIFSFCWVTLCEPCLELKVKVASKKLCDQRDTT